MAICYVIKSIALQQPQYKSFKIILLEIKLIDMLLHCLKGKSRIRGFLKSEG